MEAKPRLNTVRTTESFGVFVFVLFALRKVVQKMLQNVSPQVLI